jgi:hypothetical protein
LISAAVQARGSPYAFHLHQTEIDRIASILGILACGMKQPLAAAITFQKCPERLPCQDARRGQPRLAGSLMMPR